MSIEDAKLVAATRAGRTEAFERLVERHQGLVCGVAFSQTGDATLSEDLAQEAFTIAWQGLHRLDKPARFGDWVAGIVRNLGRGERKRRHREEARSEVDDVDPRPHLDEAIEDRNTERLLWATLERIPEPYREALVLYYREGQSTGEVARVLEVSIPSVQQRLSRGRKYLRAEVERVLQLSLAKSRPRKTFAGAVIAGLPARSSATTATAGGMMMKAFMGGLLALAASVSGAAWCHLDAEAVSSPQSVDGPAAPAASSVKGVEAARVVFARDRASAAAGEPPTAYEISRLNDQVVGVNLDGGPSILADREGEVLTSGASPPIRTVTGVVVDDDGLPVKDAIVLAGHLFVFDPGNTLRASAAARTDGRGAFSLGLPSASSVPILALHHELGWSKIEDVDDGTGNQALELTLEPPPRLKGRTTRGGSSEAAALVLRRPGVDLWLFTDDEGELDRRVPAADYNVSISRGAGFEDTLENKATPTTRTVRTIPGKTETLEVELPEGGMLALFVDNPREKGIEQISYTVIPGHHEIDSLESLRDAMKSQPRNDWPWLLVRGESVGEPRQFSDLPEGPYTACATARENFKIFRGIACKLVELGPEENREVELELTVAQHE